jgi:Putative zinc-finger
MAEDEPVHGMEDAVAASVLGAAEPGEEERVRAHLAACSGCRALERRLRRMVAALLLAAPAASPPIELRARVLDAAASGTSPGAGTGRGHSSHEPGGTTGAAALIGQRYPQAARLPMDRYGSGS